jgi:aryl-alcohol dehydrogenase-like predicted oxidoreductase
MTDSHISEHLALGAMFFGTRTDEDTSFALLDRYVEAGGVWIDTADCYSFWEDPSGHGGQSELMLGRWFKARPGVRDRVKIATKVGCEPLYPGSFPEFAEGLSAGTIATAIRQSLDRLGLDHVDMYWAHRDDRAPELDETVSAFGALVSDGLIERWGYSNTAIWRVERARSLALAAGTAAPTGLQLRYSYLQPRPMVRDNDHDHRFGWITDDTLDYVESNPEFALWAYSPLMSGAYERADRPFSPAFEHPGTDRRLAALDRAAAQLGTTRSEIIVAWLTGGTPPISPIVGVSSLEQLDIALRGARLTLPDQIRSDLDAQW